MPQREKKKVIPANQRDMLHRSGYVHLKHFFDRDAVKRLRSMSDEMSRRARFVLSSAGLAGESLSHRARHNPQELIVVPEARTPSVVCRYEFMLGSHCSFREFIHSQVLPYVSLLVGESVCPFKDKTNEKPPGGGAFTPHQDFAAYRSFSPRYYVTALLSIDPTNLRNGCLQFATNLDALVSTRPEYLADSSKSSRLLQYVDHGGPNHGDIIPEIVSHLSWEPAETTPFDLVVFDAFVPHFSAMNAAGSSRRAIFITFNLTSEGAFYDHYYADKRAHYDDPKFHVSTPTLREYGTAS